MNIFSSTYQVNDECNVIRKEITQLFLQDNALVDVSIPKLQTCFPNLEYINLMDNPLKSLVCPQEMEITVIFTCTSFLPEYVTCLGNDICCCHEFKTRESVCEMKEKGNF